MLKGKEAVDDYWRKALEKLPDLQFSLFDWTQGVDSVVLYYQSVMGMVAVEVMFFNEAGKVCKMVAHYR